MPAQSRSTDFAPAVGSHFFTISEADRATLSNTPGFVAEGVAWYAYDQLQTLIATINPCPEWGHCALPHFQQRQQRSGQPSLF